MISLLDRRVRLPSGIWLLAGLFLIAGCENQAVPDRAEMQPPAVSVVTLQPGQVTLRRELPGRTRAYLIAEVRPLVTGIVQERLFREGSQVEQGEALYQLDDATYRARFQSADAMLARAVAAADIARLNAQRAEGLRESKAISDQEYQNLLATQAQAEADVKVAQAQRQRRRSSWTMRVSFRRLPAEPAARVLRPVRW
jgi:membrane fusion protein (multidrug efflux system)